MQQIKKCYEILDDMLSKTTERHIVPTGEVQNWMLDMRSELMKLEEELAPVQAEPVPVG